MAKLKTTKPQALLRGSRLRIGSLSTFAQLKNWINKSILHRRLTFRTLNFHNLTSLAQRKLPANTMVEVLIALVVSMIAFSMGTMIISNVFSSNNIDQRVEARLEIQHWQSECNIQALATGKVTKEIGNIHLERTVKPYENLEDVDLIIWKAINNQGKELARISELNYSNQRPNEN